MVPESLELTALNAQVEKIQTNDGSCTYLNRQTGATYRSVFGAESESRHVFLGGSRLASKDSPWCVLELGFGTGLNFHVTYQAAQKAGVALEYVSLEPNPLPRDHWLVEAPWHDGALDTTQENDGVKLTIVFKKWQDWRPPDDFFDACYHDPFGPGQAPDCWTKECFLWSYSALKQNGVLTTFGAASATRRAMKEAGFLVGSLVGFGGKREMTVAGREAESIDHAKPWKR